MIPPPKRQRPNLTQPTHDIKAGDLVKMKYIAFWQKKNNKGSICYTEVPMIVLETAYNAIKVITPNGVIKSDLAEYYEVVNENE